MNMELSPRASLVIKSLDQFMRTRGRIVVIMNDDPTVSAVLIEAQADFDSSGVITEYHVCVLNETDGWTIVIEVSW